MLHHSFSKKTPSLKKTIVLTGGGSGGHVTPSIPLIRKCIQDRWDVFYIGSQTGIEKELIEKEHIPYIPIFSGKLRRYFSWQNFWDPIKIVAGIVQALFILKKLKPNVIFSKGGFVSFPVVVAGKLLSIPSIVHESDLTPGLANRLCFPIAQKICLTFSETLSFIPFYQDKAIYVGPMIREEAYTADPVYGRAILQLKDPHKKILLVFAGSQGSERINTVLRSALSKLLETFQVVHICGKGKVDPQLRQPGYIQFEYLHQDFYPILACADLVIARSGANSLSELLFFQKLHILIPLAKASRGEQIFNANYFAQKGTSTVLSEQQLNVDQLFQSIQKTFSHADQLNAAMKKYKITNGVDVVYHLISGKNH